MKINLEGKKYLVTSGCSFTDGYNMAEKGSWAYYLSNMLNLELHNYARGGSGNEYISNSIISNLAVNDELRKNCIVGVAWSDISRLMSSIYDGECLILDTVQPHDFLEKGKYSNKMDASIFFSDIAFCVYKTYLSISNLNNFLNYNNIQYFYIDAINKIELEFINNDDIKICGHYDVNKKKNNDIYLSLNDYPYEYRKILNKNFSDTLFKNFLKIHDNDCILNYMISIDYDLLTKGNPGHPNDIASIEIAKSIYNQII